MLRVPVDRGTGRVPQRRTAGFTLDLVDTKKEIREFLTSRRARITPEQAGLRSYGSRRVPGLRREEVAVLAGVSVPYYTRLERGDMSGASEGVLEALARAIKHFHHPVVGELSLSFNRLDLAADHGLTIFTYTAEPGSRSEEALKLLGSWAAAADNAEPAPATDQS